MEARMVDAPALPRATLVVVSYEAADLLPGFLESLRGLDYPDWECIVVDNASTDGSRGVARESGIAQVRVIDAGANLGFGRACNLGAAAGDGDLLVFLNPDLEMPSDWLRTVVTRLQANADIAVICPITLGSDEDPADQLQDELEDVTTLPACAFVMRREDFAAAGGFDDRIFLYWEDTDLCWRTKLRGRRVVKDHSAFVVHDPGGAGGGDSQSAEQIKNGLYVHLKLASPRRTAAFAARMAAKTLVRLAQTRDPALLRAWTANVRALPRTRRTRRAVLAGVPRERRREVEALLVSQQRWQRSALDAALRR